MVSKLPARIIKKRDNGGIQWSGPGQAPPSALQSKPKNPSGRQKTSQARGGRGVQRKNDQQVLLCNELNLQLETLLKFDLWGRLEE